MLHKKRESRTHLTTNFAAETHGLLSRRGFLAATMASAGGAAAIATLPGTFVRPAAAQATATPQIERRKTICPYCAVGCSIWAEVQNGVWIGQEPAFESPVNMGTHCAKGAAARDFGHGERRLKYPTKKENGRWVRISWEQAIDEIGNRMLEIREASGPDAVYWLGSAKFSNEAAYLFRKFASFWGTNNTDHQARICHSTTVSGVANSFGYGAMTNSLNDIQNSRSMIVIGSNPCEAHPVAMLHLLHAKEHGSKLIVVDPRFTRTAAHAHEYVRIRSGTDVAFLWGILWHVFQNGWEDKQFIEQRVYGMDELRKEVERWTPEETERVTGVPAEQIARVARTLAENRPGTLIWCMGLTQSHIGNNKTRAAALVQLVLGNIGKTGGGANIFRGHDNVQGATDLGVQCHDTPGYYGLTEGAWRHWALAWGVKYDWLKDRFASVDLMQAAGMPVSRWFDGVLEAKENIDQPDSLRAMVFWGHAPNSQSRGPDLQQALDKLDLLVIVDPVATLSSVLSDRPDGIYLLPAGSTMESSGSVTNTQRALQWREKVIDPLFEAKSDYEIMYLFAGKLGFADEMFKYIEIEDGAPTPESLLNEMTRSLWSVGYTGQSPERLKLHMQNQEKFDSATSMGMEDPVKGEYYGLPWPCWGPPGMKHPGTPILYDTSKPVGAGGLPFRARWGVEHEGVPLLASDSYPEGSEITDGYPEMTYALLEKMGWNNELTPLEQLVIAAVASETFEPPMLTLSDDEAGARLQEILQQHARQGQSGQAANGQAQTGRGETGQSETGQTATGQAGEPPSGEPAAEPGGMGATGGEADGETAENQPNVATRSQGQGQDSFAEKLGKVNWKTDMSGGIQRVAIAHGLAPYGNGRARALVWTFPDPIPVHREPLYTPRRDLLPAYQTYDDRRFYRLPVLYRSIQEQDFASEYPLILTTGRLVEYEGGGDETRTNKWLAEFQQQMFAEINRQDAEQQGITDGSMVWLATPEGARVRVMALLTNRVGPGTVFMPFHFGGIMQGVDLSSRYPEGTVPYVVGEAANTATTYGYDSVTQMQETKTTLCRLETA